MDAGSGKQSELIDAITGDLDVGEMLNYGR